MADFEEWCEAAAPALGWKPGAFQKVYRRNRNETASEGLEGDVVVEAIQCYLDSAGAGAVALEGTSTSVMSTLQIYAKPDCSDWPTTATLFSERLRRLAPGLLSLGIQVSFRKTNGRRLLSICRVAKVN
jgi:hypothetical protein